LVTGADPFALSPISRHNAVMSSMPPSLPQDVQQQLMIAKVAAKKIRRVAAVATGDAWTVAIFAGLSFICGLSGGISGLAIGLAMGVVAYVEFTGASRVRRLEPAAARTLGYNQLALAGVLIIYALWSLFSGSSAMMNEIKAQLGSDAPGMEKSFEDLYKTICAIMYGSLIVVAIGAQGGMALYYFRREKLIHEYIETTPQWIIEMQRAGGID
jgi:hypothetical protein